MLKFKNQNKNTINIFDTMSQKSKQNIILDSTEDDQSYLNMEPINKQKNLNEFNIPESSLDSNTDNIPKKKMSDIEIETKPNIQTLDNNLKNDDENKNNDIKFEVAKDNILDIDIENNNDIILGCTSNHDDNDVTIDNKHYINANQMETCEIYQPSVMTATEFIKEKKYDIKIEEWFTDIWYALIEDSDIIVTKAILSFFFKNKTDISTSNYDIFKSYREKYRNYLTQCNIPFETIKYYPTIAEKYPILKTDLFLSNNPTKKVWIKLPFKNFKESIMLLSTPDSKETRKMFMLLEQIFYDYNKYAIGYHTRQFEIEYKNKLSVKERENKELKNKICVINDMVIQKGNIHRNQIFYIATSRLYGMQNIFKIGGVENRSFIKSKFNTPNTEKSIEDNFFYVALYECHDYKLVEQFLSSFLNNFKIPNKNDLFKINFDNLNNVVGIIIDQLDEYISYFNCMQPKFIDNLIFVRDLKENIEIKNKEKGIWLNTNNLKKKTFVIQNNSLSHF